MTKKLEVMTTKSEVVTTNLVVVTTKPVVMTGGLVFMTAWGEVGGGIMEVGNTIKLKRTYNICRLLATLTLDLSPPYSVASGIKYNSLNLSVNSIILATHSFSILISRPRA